MRAPMLGVIAALLAACQPSTHMIQDGHYWIQLTQSHYFWGQNVVHVTRCHVDDKKDGFCQDNDLRQSEQMEIVEAPGPKIASAALIGASILGGTALLMHGYQHQAVSQPAQSNTLQGASISTLNTCKSGPAFVGMAPAPGC